MARYDGSFFQLRHDIDSLLNAEQPPRLVVYVPEDREKTDHALIELEVAGTVVQPGQQPPTRNTRLAIVARNALKSILGDETAAEIEKQVDAGKLSLANLNALAEKGKDISAGVLSLIFGTSHPQEVALAFLNSDTFDHDIEQKSARPQLLGLVRNAFEIALPASVPLADVRQRLARHVLLTEFLTGLGEAATPSLATIKIASTSPTREACSSLAHTWWLRRDARDSYIASAKHVEQTLGPASFVISPSFLEAVNNGQRGIDHLETFPAMERALLQHVEHALLQSADATLLDLAQSWLCRFWSDVTPAVQAHWVLIAVAAKVLLQADRVATALKNAPSTVPALIRAYTEGDAPWCLLDTAHRHMESRWYAFEPESGTDYGSLEQLIVRAEHRYAEVGSELAQHFTRTLEKAKHPQKDILYQRNVFATQVKPRLDHGKTAYVWVDALRFEMARELCHVLQDDFDLTLQPALGTIPTITEIGMAALLPKAGESAKVITVGGGKLGLEIDGTIR